jgi:hypothetical protein
MIATALRIFSPLFIRPFEQEKHFGLVARLPKITRPYFSYCRLLPGGRSKYTSQRPCSLPERLAPAARSPDEFAYRTFDATVSLERADRGKEKGVVVIDVGVAALWAVDAGRIPERIPQLLEKGLVFLFAVTMVEPV